MAAPQRLAWSKCPLGIALIGQQVAHIQCQRLFELRRLHHAGCGQRRSAQLLEFASVDPNRLGKTEYPISERHCRVGRARTEGRIKGLAQGVEGAVQVVGAGGGIGFRPEELDRLILDETPLPSQALEQCNGLPPGPDSGRQGLRLARDLKAA
jgi:hypothetical protein